MIKELGIDNLLDNPTYTPTPPTTKEIWTIIGMLYVPLKLQLKMTNLILHNPAQCQRKMNMNHDWYIYFLYICNIKKNKQ